MAAVLAGKAESARYERVLADADGGPLPVLIDATLLRDTQGRPDEAAHR